MSTLDIHILAGDPALLTPDPVHGQALASLIGPEFRCVSAYWLSSECGRYNHNFLADYQEDSRIEVFARGLMTDYVRGPRPFLIIPGLLDEPSIVATPDRKDWGSVLAALADAIRALGGDCIFYLHLLTGPFASDATMRLECLQNWIEDRGLKARLSEDAVTRLASDDQHSIRLERNYLSGQLAITIAERCKHSGFAVSDMDLLTKFVTQCLERWERIGLRPSLPLQDVHLSRLTEAVISQMLDPAGQRVTR